MYAYDQDSRGICKIWSEKCKGVKKCEEITLCFLLTSQLLQQSLESEDDGCHDGDLVLICPSWHTYAIVLTQLLGSD